MIKTRAKSENVFLNTRVEPVQIDIYNAVGIFLNMFIFVKLEVIVI